MTYFEACWLEFRNRFPKDLLTRMDTKSTPSHGNSIPLPSTFAESVVGKFPHDIGLGDLKLEGSESRNFHIRYAMCF